MGYAWLDYISGGTCFDSDLLAEVTSRASGPCWEGPGSKLSQSWKACGFQNLLGGLRVMKGDS